MKRDVLDVNVHAVLYFKYSKILAQDYKQAMKSSVRKNLKMKLCYFSRFKSETLQI